MRSVLIGWRASKGRFSRHACAVCAWCPRLRGRQRIAVRPSSSSSSSPCPVTPQPSTYQSCFKLHTGRGASTHGLSGTVVNRSQVARLTACSRQPGAATVSPVTGPVCWLRSPPRGLWLTASIHPFNTGAASFATRVGGAFWVGADGCALVPSPIGVVLTTRAQRHRGAHDRSNRCSSPGIPSFEM